jgi:iron(III) transport system ATP-binding protein
MTTDDFISAPAAALHAVLSESRICWKNVARRTAWSAVSTVLFFLTACDRSSSPDALAVRDWRTWQLPPDGPTLPTPRSVAVGNHDELAVLDTAGRVLLYDAQGTFQRQWKMLDVSVGKPEGIIILQDGRIVVCDTHYHRIVYFDASGNWLRNFGQRGREPGEFEYPVGICKDNAENLYVCEYGGNDRVQKFSREGEFLTAFGSFGTEIGQFQRPSGLTWHDNKLYVADAINNRVLIFTDGGNYLGLLGEADKPLAFELPYDITFARDGNLYVVEYGAGRLSRIGLDGILRGRLGRTGSGPGEFATPWGLTVDSQMRIHVADTKNRRVVTLRL